MRAVTTAKSVQQSTTNDEQAAVGRAASATSSTAAAAATSTAVDAERCSSSRRMVPAWHRGYPRALGSALEEGAQTSGYGSS